MEIKLELFLPQQSIDVSGYLHAPAALPPGTQWIGGWIGSQIQSRRCVARSLPIYRLSHRDFSLLVTSSKMITDFDNRMLFSRTNSERENKLFLLNESLKTKLRGFSPQANNTDRATAACARS
jgi:hypothetical protein